MPTLLETLLNPISAESFAGEDGSYDTDFELARTEADKSSGNNFDVMEESSKRFLETKSKDMRAMGYLTWSAAMNKGADAFAECVIAYCKLVMDHWEDIHPKRPAARSNAIKWLNGERVLALLGGISTSGTYETLCSANEELNKLSAFCDQKFAGSPPTFMGFSKLVRELAETNKPKPVEEISESTTTQSSAAASSPTGISSADDAFIAIQNGAYFLMEESQTNSLPYRLVRMLKWDSVQMLPPSNGGKTMIPAPYSTAMETFQNLFAEQTWAELTKNGEEAFSVDGMLFWFDLQRYICAGLQGLGPEYNAASKGIRLELALLLNRFPNLADLYFEDGTPFADAMTKEWIQTDVLTSLGGSGGGGGPAPIKKKGDVGEEQKEAVSLFGEGKLDQALNVLRTGVANDSNEKNNFDRKLIMAEICYKAGKPNISRAILGDLLASIEKYSLLKWDTELCISVFHLSQKVYLSLFDSSEDELKFSWRQKALEMHSQISTLDPVLAVASEIK